MEENKKEMIVAIVAWVLVVCIILVKHKKAGIIINDLYRPLFTISLITIIIFSIYCWHSKNKKLKLASEKAIVSFIIAYLSRLDLVFAVYFIIFIFAYYVADDII